jgi:MFS family permease
VTARIGNARLLIGGVFVALVGMAWLSRIGADTPYFPQIAVPMVLLGLGIGSALTPLTAAGMAGVESEDAGAASGVVNVAQQLGSSLGLAILVTVFAAADRAAAHHPVGATARLQGAHALAHAVATSLRGSAVFLALGLAVVVLVMRRPTEKASEPVVETPAQPATARVTGGQPTFPPVRVWAQGPGDARHPTVASDTMASDLGWRDVAAGEERKCS